MNHSVSAAPSQEQLMLEILDDFAYSINYLSSDARPISSLNELPWNLRKAAMQCGKSRWRAWSSAVSLWYFEAIVLFDDKDVPTLKSLFYNRDGAPVAAGVWKRDRFGLWILFNVIDTDEFLAETRTHKETSKQSAIRIPPRELFNNHLPKNANRP